MASHVLHIFWDVDLRCSHDGLEAHVKRHKKEYSVDLKRLRRGEFVIFFNSAMSKVKLYAAHRVVAYTRSERNSRLDPQVISRIAEAFDATGEINYEKKLREVLLERLRNKNRVDTHQERRR